MSGAIIDPKTGLPTNFGKADPMMQQQIMQLVQAYHQLHGQIQSMSQQQVHLGLFSEYLQKKITELGVEFDDDEFQEFAKVRWEEIREEAKAHLEAQQREAKAASVAQDLGVDLDE